MPRVNGAKSVGSLAGRFRSVNGRRRRALCMRTCLARNRARVVRTGWVYAVARGEDGRPWPRPHVSGLFGGASYSEITVATPPAAAMLGTRARIEPGLSVAAYARPG